MRFALAATAAVMATVFGPPHLHVAATTAAPAMNTVAFTLDVEHHTRLDQLAVTGRAETLRQGARVSRPLALTRVDSTHYTVTRTWDADTPWVLVFAAEQGPDGAHGVVEALVSIDRRGTIKDITYTTPGFVERSGAPRRVTQEQVDRKLRALLP